MYFKKALLFHPPQALMWESVASSGKFSRVDAIASLKLFPEIFWLTVSPKIFSSALKKLFVRFSPVFDLNTGIFGSHIPHLICFFRKDFRALTGHIFFSRNLNTYASSPLGKKLSNFSSAISMSHPSKFSDLPTVGQRNGQICLYVP